MCLETNYLKKEKLKHIDKLKSDIIKSRESKYKHGKLKSLGK